MYQRDYILRMIEMLGELITGILGLIKKGEFPKAELAIENAYFNFLQEDTSYLQNIPKENLTEKLLTEHNFTNDHLEILSELFFAQAELYQAKKNIKDAVVFYEKSLVLLDFVVKESKTFSAEKQVKQSLLRDRVSELNEKG